MFCSEQLRFCLVLTYIGNHKNDLFYGMKQLGNVFVDMTQTLQTITKYFTLNSHVFPCFSLVKRLLSQGYKVNRLSNTFKKFYGRHTDLVGQYKKNVCQMFADSIS